MNRKHFVFSLIVMVCAAALTIVLNLTNSLQKMDYRFYDLLTKCRKEPAVDSRIAVVACDDASINLLGEWPWSRDIIADALLRLKECGASAAIFDIEYLSPSSLGVMPDAQEHVNGAVYAAQSTITQSLGSLGDAVALGYYEPSEVPELVSELNAAVVESAFEELDGYLLGSIYRDNDDYFARCIRAFGNTWLTINTKNLGLDVDADEAKYIENQFLLSNVQDEKGLTKLGNEHTAREAGEERGFSPALFLLATHARGLSFTNSTVDNDGTRRRMELLSEHNGKFVPQLTFGPYLDQMGATKIIRTKKYLMVQTEGRAIRIPVDAYGRLLVNWRKGTLIESFPNVPVIKLHDLDSAERDIASCLTNICLTNLSGSDGYRLEAVTQAAALLELYGRIAELKDMVLYDDADFSLYTDAQEQFLSAVGAYVAEPEHLRSVEQWFDEFSQYVDASELEYIRADFDALAQEFYFYTELKRELTETLTGKFCIIGNTATSTTDIGATPVQKQFENVGIHANVLNTLLQEDFLRPVAWQFPLAVSMLLSVLLLFFTGRAQHVQNIAGGVLKLASVIVFLLAFVCTPYYLPLTGALVYIITDYVANVVYRFQVSSQEKKFITMMAASFANKDTVEELRKNPEAFRAGGQKKNITALFSDIQSFSTFSEKMDTLYGEDGPNRLIEVLNEYLGAMSKAILFNNGTIDKYEGDAIISMFGAPDAGNLHTPQEWAYYALASAIRMKQTEVEFNRTHFDPADIAHSAIPNPLYTRIGLNSGAAFVGLMGSKTDEFNKLNYTMIGDTVNLASRLEGVNKPYKTWIMCSDSTWQLADSGEFEGKLVARALDRVRVVGKAVPVQLYNVLGFKSDMSGPELEKAGLFNEAMGLYHAQDFARAEKLFSQAQSMPGGDETAGVFAARCGEFIRNGVPDGWDGIVNMTSK